MPDYRFAKSERLSGERQIERLFRDGTGGMAWPVRYLFVADGPQEGGVPAADGSPAVSVLISVSKRNHKHAVDRNRLKRRMREAYRLNKSALTEIATEKGARVHLALIYASKEISDYQTIEHAVRKILQTVGARL